MSYGDIVGRLIRVLANEGTSKLEHIIKSSQQTQSGGGILDFVMKFFKILFKVDSLMFLKD